MKTPREILFERHESAGTKLDALRRGFVDEQAARDSARAERSRSVAQKLWCELVLPCRRIWMGLAAVWVVSLGLHFMVTGDEPRVALAKISPPTPEVLTVLKEQKQMMAQLLGPVASPVVLPGKPGPRSEAREESYDV